MCLRLLALLGTSTGFEVGSEHSRFLDFDEAVVFAVFDRRVVLDCACDDAITSCRDVNMLSRTSVYAGTVLCK